MEGNVDADLAYAAIMTTVFNSGGIDQIQQALGGTGDPVQTLAQVIFGILTMAKESSQQASIPDNVWLSPGGVVDRVVKDICQLASSMGVQGAESPEFGVQVKEAVVAEMRNEAGAGQPSAPPPQGLLAQAATGAPPPVGGGMGGMPNG